MDQLLELVENKVEWLVKMKRNISELKERQINKYMDLKMIQNEDDLDAINDILVELKKQKHIQQIYYQKERRMIDEIDQDKSRININLRLVTNRVFNCMRNIDSTFHYKYGNLPGSSDIKKLFNFFFKMQNYPFTKINQDHRNVSFALYEYTKMFIQFTNVKFKRYLLEEIESIEHLKHKKCELINSQEKNLEMEKNQFQESIQKSRQVKINRPYLFQMKQDD